MGDLKFSTIKMPTLNGPVKGEYQVVNSRLKTFAMELPAGVVGEFSVDTSVNTTITLNGKTVASSLKILPLKSGINHIEIKVK